MMHEKLVKETSLRHGLPPGLVRSVVAVESGGNAWAIRYEPAFFERYVKPDASVRPVSPCSAETEKRARATSWGLMQVMGATARGLGFEGAYLSQLCDPATGLDLGCKLLARLRDKHKAAHGWAGVVAAYNAGSPRKDGQGRFVNQAYVDKIAARLGESWPD